MFADVLARALGNIFSALYLLGGAYIYISLIRQIRVRTALPDLSSSASKRFDWPEALLAAGLISFLLLNVFSAASRSVALQLTSQDLIANLLFITALVLFIASFLRVRRFNLDALGGFSRLSFLRAVSTGIILLIFTLPLMSISEAIVQTLFGIGSSRQEIIDLFNHSSTLQQRVIIVILAVVVAPIAEEFIFRLFLYGVLKRYLGIGLALILNALLFAAVHTHLPSFAPLFVLAVCFTLAYEWSGSILVSMTMHAFFNGIQLTALAFPQFVPQ
jgi:membrane protease YdiL (CAAX protease family)